MKNSSSLLNEVSSVAPSSGLASLMQNLRLARVIAAEVNKCCRQRHLQIAFDGPSQVRLDPKGRVTLIVPSQAQSYQLRNLLPTLTQAIARATGCAPGSVKIAVNPGLLSPWTDPEPPAGEPRRSNPEAAQRIAEKAKRLPEGSRMRKTLEELARSLAG